MKKIKGWCKFCEKSIEKVERNNHFLTCFPRLELFKKLSQKTQNKWLFLRAQQTPYWMDFLFPEQWLLSDLDRFLRNYWLECCGHLSLFRIDGTIYERFQDPDWISYDETLPPNMEVKLGALLSPGKIFNHEYDYGTTTELELKVLDLFSISVKKRVFLCAQNEKPQWPCSNCNKLASYRCGYCEAYACDRCSPIHPCVVQERADHMMTPLVNSPRTGICGYDGTTPGQ